MFEKYIFFFIAKKNFLAVKLIQIFLLQIDLSRFFSQCRNTLYQHAGKDEKSHVSSITTYLSDFLKKCCYLKSHEHTNSSG